MCDVETLFSKHCIVRQRWYRSCDSELVSEKQVQLSFHHDQDRHHQ